MKISVIKVGKPTSTEVVGLVTTYEKRLKSLLAVGNITIKDLPKIEAGRPTPYCNPGEYLIVLDERGEQKSSKDFAADIQGLLDDPRVKSLYFLIGGPYGLGDAWRAKAKRVISLSELTVPSDLAWLLLWEQLYRSATILKGMPYHHDG